MEASVKDEIMCDFVCVINQIDDKPSDGIEFRLQKIVSRIGPLIHKV